MPRVIMSQSTADAVKWKQLETVLLIDHKRNHNYHVFLSCQKLAKEAFSFHSFTYAHSKAYSRNKGVFSTFKTDCSKNTMTWKPSPVSNYSKEQWTIITFVHCQKSPMWGNLAHSSSNFPNIPQFGEILQWTFNSVAYCELCGFLRNPRTTENVGP